MSPETRRKVDELEKSKPDPARDPHSFARINDEISRLIDEDRAYQNALKGFRVV